MKNGTYGYNVQNYLIIGRNKRDVLNIKQFVNHLYNYLNLSNEYPNFEELYYFCQALKDSWVDDEVIMAYAEHTGDELDNELIANAEDYYVGTFDSFQEYADDFADEQLYITDDFLKSYFDYERYARDLRYDYTVLDLSDSNVAIFNNC